VVVAQRLPLALAGNLVESARIRKSSAREGRDAQGRDWMNANSRLVNVIACSLLVIQLLG
jgi:hypothetical protein